MDRGTHVGREVRVARRSLGRGRAGMGWREGSDGRNKVGKDGDESGRT